MKNVLGSILKIVIFLLALPLIIASIMAFQDHILSLPVNEEVSILWGGAMYVVFNLFIYDFQEVYVFGKTWMEKIFTFFKAAGYVIPVYSVLLVFTFVLLLVFGKLGARASGWQEYFLFAIAFMFVMHLTKTAYEIYEADKSLLKAHYGCVFGAILVVNIFFISLLFAWIIPEYSFVGFIKSLSAHTCHLYKVVFKALFVDSGK